MSPKSEKCHQNQKNVTNITIVVLSGIFNFYETVLEEPVLFDDFERKFLSFLAVLHHEFHVISYFIHVLWRLNT